MKGSTVLFSKKSDEWETPDALFSQLDREFGFELDAAATNRNTKCRHWFGPNSPIGVDDALTLGWGDYGHKVVFCNPPYSKTGAFVAKAVEAQARGITTVMLLPSRTDTRWWHQYVWEEANARPRPGIEVRFIKGRLKFSDSDDSAPFPSVIVVFRGRIS